ncbi:hypothetical protein [Microbulbifer aggregans]|uniref:hypothetical protein n=1 Tax=Microbulbifer aggregans TaxID=1769779 RepID=UPI001CFEA3FB|nr:hypothetical protein [Microbulbifer aggregans]
MKTQYWEPWQLDEESRNQMIGKAFAERIHLVTDLKVADEVAQGLEALYSPDMGLDELRVLERKVRNVALFAENIVEGYVRHCDRANALMDTIGKHFVKAGGADPEDI